jgi:hypothetical protein
MYTLITTLLSPLLHQFAISCTKTPFLGLIPWYQYLDMTEVNIIDPHTHQTIAGECRIEGFSGDSKLVLGAHSPFLLIALAILDDLIRLAAMVAVGYVIYGGVLYTTSQGAPDMVKKAQQTIINALIGVGVAIVAAAVVAFIGYSLSR